MEGKKVFIVPDDKREEYFIFVDEMKNKCNLTFSISEEVWNTYNDPVVIVDVSYFSKQNAKVILDFFNRIKAVEITKQYFSI